jgi:sortase A
MSAITADEHHERSELAGGAAATTARRSKSGETVKFLFGALWTRPSSRRAISGISILLAVVGLGMLAYPFATNLWQDKLQDRLAKEFRAPETKAAYQEGTVAVGDPLTRLKIKTLDVNVVVVEGTTASALRAGAGHYPNTPLPGEPGNVAIAGHRTTYGKPFANLDRMKVGDEIILDTPIGRHVYKVSEQPFVVPNTDWKVISQSPGEFLTLTTCHPKGSDRQRLVVRAEMVSERSANSPQAMPASRRAA